MQQPLLPLFPLQVVLLPHSPLPLHIFEERYKEMIGEAIQNKTEFGVVLASEKGIVNTGCTAVVERVVKEYPDGRMDIIASGRRRFEILLLNDEKDYLQGAVEFFDDETFDAPATELVERVEEGFRELKALAEPDDATPAENMPLSFRVAQSIPDLDVRQMLLMARSEAERIKVLAEVLPALVQRLRTAVHMRMVAPRNGHGKHLNL
jgi:Lon protease-like protein